MTTLNSDSQTLESYLPVYDTAPEKWEDARAFIVEQFKVHANAINAREIGFFLDQELIAGKQFIPGQNDVLEQGSSQRFRTVLRKVIFFDGLAVGPNTAQHDILVDVNFTLIQLFGAATNSVAFTGEPLPNGADTISYDDTNIIINVAAAYDRAYAVIEYLQEL